MKEEGKRMNKLQATLTHDELAVLKRLMDSPCRAIHIMGFFSNLETMLCLAGLEDRGLIRSFTYTQKYRKFGVMMINHITFAGRRALIQQEVNSEECPYICPDCGKKLTSIKGLWGCLCEFGGKFPSPAQVEKLADKHK